MSFEVKPEADMAASRWESFETEKGWSIKLATAAGRDLLEC